MGHAGDGGSKRRVIRQEESVCLTPQRLSHELDDIADPADALAIVSDNDGGCSKCAIGALANDMSRRLDALYAEAHDALEEPTSFLGKRVRK